MKKIAIITARGGSKRIKNKNIKDFLGKPIIAYSILAAIESNQFDEIMVSTDSEEIKNVALSYGAKVPFMRSKKNSDDFATTSDVLKEVLEEYSKRGINFDIACCIYPTAPFITSEKINNSINTLISNNYDCVLPVVEFSFNPLRGFTIDGDKVKYMWPDNASKRSQDLEKVYHDCGQFYTFKVSEFLNNGLLINNNTGAIIVSELEMQDIDNITDWKIAEMKYLSAKEGQYENK